MSEMKKSSSSLKILPKLHFLLLFIFWSGSHVFILVQMFICDDFLLMLNYRVVDTLEKT